jgi:hypothetical protein
MARLNEGGNQDDNIQEICGKWEWETLKRRRRSERKKKTKVIPQEMTIKKDRKTDTNPYTVYREALIWHTLRSPHSLRITICMIIIVIIIWKKGTMPPFDSFLLFHLLPFSFFTWSQKNFLRMARPSRKMFRSNVQKYDQQAKKLWTRDGRLVQRPPAYQLFVFNFLLILITKWKTRVYNQQSKWTISATRNYCIRTGFNDHRQSSSLVFYAQQIFLWRH